MDPSSLDPSEAGKKSSQLPSDDPSVDAAFDRVIEEEAVNQAETAKSRIPPEHAGIQINHCKNPTCVNFGVPEKEGVAKWAKGGGNRYKLSSAGKHYPHLTCLACGSMFPMKSNRGISEELERIRAEGSAGQSEPCCPDEDCPNHGIGVSIGKPYYASFGKTAIGSPRWRCSACMKTFSAAKKSTHRQRDSHKNKLIFQLLLNKMPLRRICEVAEVGPNTLYGKIKFINSQCLKFIADREAALPKLAIRRLYLSVDRQDYQVNWTKREDRRNTIVSAVASVDNETGYCFGLHLNFEPSLDPEATEEDAWAAGDHCATPPFRKHARLWLQSDYDKSVMRAKNSIAITLRDKVARTYAQAAAKDDAESSTPPTDDEKLPDLGMLVHSEYTLYAHFLRLKELTAGAEKIRFFLDQDSGMRAACLAAFADDIGGERRADAFFVRIAKEMTVDQRRKAKGKAKEDLDAFMEANPTLDKSQAILAILKQRIAAMAAIGPWGDRWVDHPFPDMSEPEKAVCYLTDFGDYDPDHLAWLVNKASLHYVDNLFMQIRRRLMLLERGVTSQGNAGRTWYGYSPYNPSRIETVLGIFRTFHNYIHVGDDKRTPAMRLGLAKGPVKYEDVLYFN